MRQPENSDGISVSPDGWEAPGAPFNCQIDPEDGSLTRACARWIVPYETGDITLTLRSGRQITITSWPGYAKIEFQIASIDASQGACLVGW